MVGLRCHPAEALDQPQGRVHDDIAATHFSDDERSITADSWSVRSEYGSTLDGEDTRHADLGVPSFRTLDYSSDKEDRDTDVEPSVLGLQSHWDATYADELVNFYEHGDSGEIWFGEEVMDTMAAWAAKICAIIASGDAVDSATILAVDSVAMPATQELVAWNVLDIGTGNGLLLHALAKIGFSDLTGIDYSESAIELGRAVAHRSAHSNIIFLVDDILETKLQRQFKLVVDKGTLDAIGLHPDGSARRLLYWKSVSKLVAPGGVLVITSCNNTKDELIEEATSFSTKAEDSISTSSLPPCTSERQMAFRYIDHVRTYPTFRFGGSEGTRVCTVAFHCVAL